MTAHTFLVAFEVEESTGAPGREHTERLLSSMLPDAGHGSLLSWWIAEDDRRDGSDNDSAVFVPPGSQDTVSKMLWAAGLTPKWNITEKGDDSRWEVPEPA